MATVALIGIKVASAALSPAVESAATPSVKSSCGCSGEKPTAKAAAIWAQAKLAHVLPAKLVVLANKTNTKNID